MTFTCIAVAGKPVCDTLGISLHHYKPGFRFCSKCDKYFETESLKCPCCSCRTRGKPRGRPMGVLN